MFGSKDREQTAPGAGAETRAAQRSHIAEGMTVTGDIEGDIDLLLDGTLEGNLRCRAVTVGKSGRLHGRIIAQEAVIDGTVEGDIDAKTVRLNVTAEMIGDVRHEVIEVAAGARIEGNYSRRDSKPKIDAAGPQAGNTGKPVVKSSHKTDVATPPPKAPATGPAAARTASAGESRSGPAPKPDATVAAMHAGAEKPL